jgi:hypothetical protein
MPSANCDRRHDIFAVSEKISGLSMANLDEMDPDRKNVTRDRGRTERQMFSHLTVLVAARTTSDGIRGGEAVAQETWE